MERGNFSEAVRAACASWWSVQISISHVHPSKEPRGLRRVAFKPRREPSWHVHRRQRRRTRKPQISRAFRFALKRAHMPKPLPILLMPRAAACCIRISLERKSGKGGTVSDWSQSDLAVRLQLAGLDIDPSQLPKIECHLVHVSDFEQLYFVRIFKVSCNDLLPSVGPLEKISDFLARTMERKRAPIPRGKRSKKGKPAKKNSRSAPVNRMTWEEIVTLLISYQQSVHVIRGDGLDAVSLQLARQLGSFRSNRAED